MNPKHTPVSLILVNKGEYAASVKNPLAAVTSEKYSLAKDLSFEFVYSTSGVFLSIVRRKSGEPPIVLKNTLLLPVFSSEDFPTEVFTHFTVSTLVFLEPEKTGLPDFYRYLFENHFQITNTRITLVKKQSGTRIKMPQHTIQISFTLRDPTTRRTFKVKESCDFFSMYEKKHLLVKKD